jgi:hypothetical protein
MMMMILSLSAREKNSASQNHDIMMCVITEDTNKMSDQSAKNAWECFWLIIYILISILFFMLCWASFHDHDHCRLQNKMICNNTSLVLQ